MGNTVQICDFPNIATDLEPYVDDYPKKLLQYPFNIPFLNVCNECGRQIYNFVGSVLIFCVTSAVVSALMSVQTLF